MNFFGCSRYSLLLFSCSLLCPLSSFALALGDISFYYTWEEKIFEPTHSCKCYLQCDCKVWQLNEIGDNTYLLFLMRYGTLDDDQTDEFQPGCKLKV